MIGKNYKYNWLDLSAGNVFNTNIALDDVEHMTGQRTDIIDNVNDHWSIASNTLESGRLIGFSWYVFGINKAIRWLAWKELNSKINIEPYVNEDPFKKLEFETDEWEYRRCMAKVNEKPKWTNGMNDSRIRFNFTLYVNSNELFGKDLNIETSTSGAFGGTSFPNSFWDSWGATIWSVNCINSWNFRAWCRIQCPWTLVNPKIKNTANWQEFKISWTTTNLVLDSLWWQWSVTDEWLDIMYKRESWVPIYLSPWDNYIVVVDDLGNVVNYTVSRYDTRNTV